MMSEVKCLPGTIRSATGPVKPVIWDELRKIIRKHDPEFSELASVERFAFYEQAKRAYCVVATGESALYANIILRKGVIAP